MYVHTFNVVDILPVLNDEVPECHLVLYMLFKFMHAHTLNRLDIRPVLKIELFSIRVRTTCNTCSISLMLMCCYFKVHTHTVVKL